MNQILLIIILSSLFLLSLVALVGAVVIVAERRIKKAQAISEIWQEIAKKANKKLEDLGYREFDL